MERTLRDVAVAGVPAILLRSLVAPVLLTLIVQMAFLVAFGVLLDTSGRCSFRR